MAGTARALQTINSGFGTFERRDVIRGVPQDVVAAWVDAGIAALDPEAVALPDAGLAEANAASGTSTCEACGHTFPGLPVIGTGCPSCGSAGAFAFTPAVPAAAAKPSAKSAAKPRATSSQRRKTTRRVADGAGG